MLIRDLKIDAFANENLVERAKSKIDAPSRVEQLGEVVDRQ